MRKEELSIDITFNPCSFSLDSLFKAKVTHLISKNRFQSLKRKNVAYKYRHTYKTSPLQKVSVTKRLLYKMSPVTKCLCNKTSPVTKRRL
jgi:hypothetical protein